MLFVFSVVISTESLKGVNLPAVLHVIRLFPYQLDHAITVRNHDQSDHHVNSIIAMKGA